MGLTIHYSLHARGGDAQARRLIQALHQAAQDLPFQHLGPLVDLYHPAPPVTPGGWTQARAKLRHTAFIELNQTVALPLACAPAQAALLLMQEFQELLMAVPGLALPHHLALQHTQGGK